MLNDEDATIMWLFVETEEVEVQMNLYTELLWFPKLLTFSLPLAPYFWGLSTLYTTTIPFSFLPLRTHSLSLQYFYVGNSYT